MKIVSTFNFSKILSIIFCVFSLNSFVPHRVLIVNKTQKPLSFILLDRPIIMSDSRSRELVTLAPGEKISKQALGPVVAWYQPGRGMVMGIIDTDDVIISLIQHDGEIKAIHGEIRELKFSNTRINDVSVYIKNHNKFNQNCYQCVDRCYAYDESLRYCNCLEWCWDKTRDRTWIIEPGETIFIKAGSGTKLGVAEEVDDYEEYHTVTTLRKTVIYR